MPEVNLLGSSDPDQTTFLKIRKRHAEEAFTAAENGLEGVPIESIKLLKRFKEVDIATIRQSNRYNTEYGTDHTVENLTWLSDRILNMRDVTPRDKVRESLVGILPLDVGGPIVLKIMLEIIMDTLQSLTQSLQTLRMKDMAGENVGTVMSHLKGALILL